ncbi:Transposon Tf2-9 polyprotein [Labeo rohita]|uniref:Transposon Tf2-9 polyprotein n=1 Tax=Labeo rohita TaxID=84645 RepID=A0ABQ8L0Q5_LABRO|nr:Transposon Tf2-9 polyprotein [Labeo rohita]
MSNNLTNEEDEGKQSFNNPQEAKSTGRLLTHLTFILPGVHSRCVLHHHSQHPLSPPKLKGQYITILSITRTSQTSFSPVTHASPMTYSGLAEDCNGFLQQCSLALQMQPQRFHFERVKITFIISLLSGSTKHFREVIPRLVGNEGGNHLHQIKMSINVYALTFCTLAVSSGWNERSLLTTYRQGLAHAMRLYLAAYDDTMVLKKFIQLSLQFVIVYIDDILVYSRSEAKHRQHVAEALQCLRDHHLFLKARNMYLPSVLSAVPWVQHQFAKFYCHIIKDYSSIVSTLSNLLKGKPNSLSWSPSAAEVFKKLKTAFTSALFLIHPDPSKPFVVEVDASTTWVGVVLLQCKGDFNKLHPCAFFFRKLTLAEMNYDISNWELLAIKLALEEWRHWLEKDQHPFPGPHQP